MILSNTAATAFVHDEPIATSYTPVAPPVDFDNNRDTDAYIRPNDHGGEDRDGSLISVPITKSTKLFAFCAALNSCNLGYNLGVVAGAAPLVHKREQSGPTLSVQRRSENLSTLNLNSAIITIT